MELTLGQALQKGIDAHKDGRIEDADHFYTLILNTQPDHPEVNHNMGVLAVSVGKIQGALQFFKTALEADPSIAQFWLSYIDAFIRLNLIAEAKVVFDQAKNNGASGVDFDQLEQYFLGQELKDDQANILDSIELDEALGLAKKKFKAGEIEESKSIYNDVLQKFPKYKAALTALKLIDRVTTSAPHDPPSDQLQPIIDLYTQGQLKQVLSHANEMLKRFPNSIRLYEVAGASNVGLMQFDEAIGRFKRVIEIKPDYAEAYNNLGMALKGKGDLEASIENFKQALKIKPDYFEAHANLGNLLNQTGESVAAIASYELALKIKPDFAEAYNNMGIIFNQTGDSEAAIKSYKQALEIKPDFAEAYNNMGLAFNNRGDLEKALDSYVRAVTIKPHYAEAFNNMGLALNDREDPNTAIDSFKKAILINPNYAGAYYNMGNALRDMDRLEAAIKSYKESVSINPGLAEAHRAISALTHYKKNDEHISRMENLYLDPNNTDEQRCHLSFSLSKASEDLNEFSQSFNYLKIGNELLRKISPYDIKQDIELFAQLKKSFFGITESALQASDETIELRPIFILGMPRSGTTLVEQIISSHSEVKGAGELDYVDRFGQSIAKGLIKPNPELILSFRKQYIDALDKRIGARGFVTDKMPQNFLYIGLILSAFPDAKIVHVNRDPAATCWSNYKHYFSNKDLGYGNDLDEVVTYFGLYKDLMQFWKRNYGDRIYDLHYDSLTINQEDETKKLTQYLGLVWQDSCLSPQDNNRSVRTASQEQVRQKVYQGSSQQWQKFEPYLGNAFDPLTKFM